MRIGVDPFHAATDISRAGRMRSDVARRQEVNASGQDSTCSFLMAKTRYGIPNGCNCLHRRLRSLLLHRLGPLVLGIGVLFGSETTPSLKQSALSCRATNHSVSRQRPSFPSPHPSRSL